MHISFRHIRQVVPRCIHGSLGPNESDPSLALALRVSRLGLGLLAFSLPLTALACGLPTRLFSGMSHRASVLSGRCLLSMLQAVSTGWPQKSKLLILSEYVNETEKIGGT